MRGKDGEGGLGDFSNSYLNPAVFLVCEFGAPPPTPNFLVGKLGVVFLVVDPALGLGSRASLTVG